jgi:short-subunit dehydrogenase
MSAKGKIVVLGATSPIARATAEAFARGGWGVLLAARDREENETLAGDLRIRGGGEVWTLAFDALDFAGHDEFVKRCCETLGEEFEGVVLCFGTMPPQGEAEKDWATAKLIIDGNYSAAVSLLEKFAAAFEARKRGWICGVSSVAGERGRMSNYIYGSAKAGFSAYLDGLRNRLWHSGVHVLSVKPGPVDTPMTFGMDKLPFLAQPGPVGESIYRAILAKRNTIYAPGIWRIIMGVIKSIPEFQFKKMKM